MFFHVILFIRKLSHILSRRYMYSFISVNVQNQSCCYMGKCMMHISRIPLLRSCSVFKHRIAWLLGNP